MNRNSIFLNFEESPPSPDGHVVVPELAAFVQVHWKPSMAQIDPEISSYKIDVNGRIVSLPNQSIGPETALEVLRMVEHRQLELAYLPSDPSLKPRITISRNGDLLGATGFRFGAETPLERTFLKHNTRHRLVEE